MNKKQLEKEVLRLKSQGLDKEQIKNILTKSIETADEIKLNNIAKDGRVIIQSYMNDDIINCVTQFLNSPRVEKHVKSSGYNVRGSVVEYKFSGEIGDINFSVYIKDNLSINSSFDTNIDSSIYSFTINGSSFKFKFDGYDAFMSLRVSKVSNNALLFVALRTLCLGIFDEMGNFASGWDKLTGVICKFNEDYYDINNLIKLLNSDNIYNYHAFNKI